MKLNRNIKLEVEVTAWFSDLLDSFNDEVPKYFSAST
jgi:hypothetical protein